MRYELSLSLFVLFQEHDTICIHYNNASAFEKEYQNISNIVSYPIL